jgi:putative PIN family toxin of toxin-antitoxin system
MLALRLVLDTNILVSAALKPEGLERTTLVVALTKPARLYVSDSVLEEYARVLTRRDLGIRRSEQLRLLELVRDRGHLVRPSRRVDAAGDPDDNKFLECAEAARADYLITGNRRHFPAFWRSTKIVTSREFVALAGPHLF